MLYRQFMACVDVQVQNEPDTVVMQKKNQEGVMEKLTLAGSAHICMVSHGLPDVWYRMVCLMYGIASLSLVQESLSWLA